MNFNFGILFYMVVCLCQGVSDRRVREAVADGATTRKKVTRACGAGAGCGACHESIGEIIDEHRARVSARSSAERAEEATSIDFGVAVTA